MQETGPSRRHQRKIVFIFFFLSGLISASWSARIPDVQQKLGANNAVMGTVLFFLYAGLFIGLAIASWLVTSYGSKKILFITCIFSALLLVLAGVGSSVIVLMLILFFIGFVRTIFNLSANTAALEVQHFYERPIIAGFHGVWSVACLVAGGIATGMIIWKIQPLPHFAIIAAIVLLSLLLFQKRSSGETIGKERRPFFVKPDRYLFLLGLIGLCAMLCEGAMFDWSVSYFEKVIHPKRSLVTVGYLCFITMMAGGRLIGDRLIATFGMTRLLFVNGLVMALGFFIVAAFHFVLSAAIGFLLIGIGDATMVPIIYLLASKTKKMPAAYALSSVTMIAYTGFLIGPLFIGNVSQYFGLPAAFFCLSIICLAILLLAYRVKRLSTE